MANLLPPFARKQLVQEYWTRVFIVILFCFSAATLIAVIMFIPYYVHVTSQLASIRESIQDAEIEHQRMEDAAQEIQDTNRLVQLLIGTDTHPQFLYYYNTLTDIAGSSVMIERFATSRTSEGVPEVISLEAVARTRQALIDFLDQLNTHPEFGRVEVPIPSLSQAENISFIISIPVLVNEV